METWAGVLLVVALALFFFSTRQFGLWLRALILLAAIAALTLSGYLTQQMEGHYRLFHVVQDFWLHRQDPANSVLAIALAHNDIAVERHAVPLLDLFFFVTAFLGFVAVLALTPGEDVERIARPFILTLLGVVLGAAFALSLVAIGFGGPVKQRAYVDAMRASQVYDGDTIVMGDVSLRLYGIDAPELDQECRQGDQLVACGEAARRELARLVDGAVVQCVAPDGDLPDESFGRPLVQCEVRRGANLPVDLAGAMVEAGYAIPYKLRDYGYAERATFGAQRYLASVCMLRPDLWRARTDRDAFLAGDPSPADITIGACARPAPSRQQN